MKISSRPLLQPSHVPVLYFLLFFFFFNDTATTEIYTLSLHDALPILRFPIRGRQSPVDISSKKLPGALRATTPDEVDPREFQLIVLGMQEAQYGTSGVRELMRWVAESRIPCLAIMNMPPLAYLKRIPGLQTDTLSECYADPDVWKSFVPGLITLSSPDPQAFRPP